METRRLAKKRRNSSIRTSRSSSPVSHRTRQAIAPISDHPAHNLQRSASTPRNSRKRVRCSDPGPRIHRSACSTGLTPAMQRTSVNALSKTAEVSPSCKARRRSALAMRSRESFDPVDPFTPASSERVMQFTPLRQILDQRTQRRIRRIGLSGEINDIEREKREARSYVKNVEILRQERDTLQQELNAMKQLRGNLEHQSHSYSSHWTSPLPQSRHMEEESTWIQDDVSVGSISNLDGPALSVGDDEDTFMINDSTVVASSSPDFRPILDSNPPISDNTSLCGETAVDNVEDTEVQSLSLDLEAARNEKTALFNACRSHMPALEEYGLGEVLRQSSPPDFFDNVVNILTTALSRASDATQALEGIYEECSTMGFSGENAKDIVDNVRCAFRSARLDLERAIPSETNGASLDNGKATLGALVKRVKGLARDLRNERKFHYGSVGREKALRGQFDSLLLRYETAAEKIGKLEGSIADSASDMLHTRIKLQDLENEDLQKNIGIGRLNAALDKYHDDMKGLEDLIGKLEDKNLAMKDKYTQQISTMEEKLASERSQRSAMEVSSAANEIRVQELEAIVTQNNTRASDLTTHIEALEKEHSRAVELLQKDTNEKVQRHEQEAGTLNVRISELTTTLETARSETQRIRFINASLEEQLQLEIDARDELLEKWAAEQARSFAYMKETVNSGRRSAKVRAANWELKSDDLMSNGTTVMGSDPITPVNTARFIDVEFGRGKSRRRFDSGIGILSEDILEDEGSSDLPHMAETPMW
ncbi:hypothetical protein N7495_008347 [Penicillium taxi]|uniref:uncharacterized protein n=1 Tax=Penicillium taxi TaxID=168475 RepID=UPI00254561BF|nr:uncharacterized protein N7495_008347 [Penicillium taxi]KAJ5888306.1 hypothetical protein N7495_008347 [Penicillium taxi]